uniref:Uncharacterized protein n=1 Tax=Romanomermis culicivorax TaxID=13658 RepID=A0A915KDS0_ROMCU
MSYSISNYHHRQIVGDQSSNKLVDQAYNKVVDKINLDLFSFFFHPSARVSTQNITAAFVEYENQDGEW